MIVADFITAHNPRPTIEDPKDFDERIMDSDAEEDQSVYGEAADTSYEDPL